MVNVVTRDICDGMCEWHGYQDPGRGLQCVIGGSYNSPECQPPYWDKDPNNSSDAPVPSATPSAVSSATLSVVSSETPSAVSSSTLSAMSSETSSAESSETPSAMPTETASGAPSARFVRRRGRGE